MIIAQRILSVGMVGLWLLAVSCSADEAIKAGTDCNQECPVGAQMSFAKEASGTCGADGSYTAAGEVTASGTCKGSGECQVVCTYPKCGANQTLVISATEFRCEAASDLCAEIDCDGHGECRIVNDAALCSCDAGYVANGAHCDPETQPVVETISPNTALVAKETTFTISGQNLPNTLYVKVEKCEGLSFVSRTAQVQEFVCTPTAPGVGLRQVYALEGGAKLFQDEATFACEHCQIEGKCYKEGDFYLDDGCKWCDSKRSKTDWSNNDGHACDDGVFCNGADLCKDGTCSDHPGDPCEQNGLFCDGVEQCDDEMGKCVSKDPPCQDNGQFCDGQETCNEQTGSCESIDAPCPDNGQFCDGAESCDEGLDGCVSSDEPCVDDGDYCNGAEACDEAADICYPEPECSSYNLCDNSDGMGSIACKQMMTASDESELADAAEDPRIAAWPDGRFVVVYKRSGYLYFRTFSAFGAPEGEAALLPSPGFDKTVYDVVAIPNGGFLLGAYGSHGDVALGTVEGYAVAEYSAQGTLLKGPLVISDSNSNGAQTSGAMGLFPSGQVGVVFRPANPGWELRHQLLDPALNEIFGGVSVVNPDKIEGAITAPAIAVAPNGSHIVAWADDAIGVVAERNAGPGMAEFAHTLISPLAGQMNPPKVGVDAQFNTFIAYTAGGTGEGATGVQLVRWGGESYDVPSPPVAMAASYSQAGFTDIAIAVQPSGQGIVVWGHLLLDNGTNPGIGYRCFAPTGETSDDSVRRANEDDELGAQTNPVAVVHPGGGYLVAWESYSANKGRVTIRYLGPCPAEWSPLE